jgi:hypothetical protein
MWILIENAERADMRAFIQSLTLDRRAALAYTGLAPKWIDQAEREGRLRALPLGARGQKRYLAADLQRMVTELYGPPDPLDGPIEFDD